MTNRDGAGLGPEDRGIAGTCGILVLGFLVSGGYLAYKLIMWLCGQTS